MGSFKKPISTLKLLSFYSSPTLDSLEPSFVTRVKSLKWEMSRSRKPKLDQNNLKSWAGCWEVPPPTLLNAIVFCFFLCV